MSRRALLGVAHHQGQATRSQNVRPVAESFGRHWVRRVGIIARAVPIVEGEFSKVYVYVNLMSFRFAFTLPLERRDSEIGLSPPLSP
jgi:hypothetical protein